MEILIEMFFFFDGVWFVKEFVLYEWKGMGLLRSDIKYKRDFYIFYIMSN